MIPKINVYDNYIQQQTSGAERPRAAGSHSAGCKQSAAALCCDALLFDSRN
jgi:hypothetical protein